MDPRETPGEYRVELTEPEPPHPRAGVSPLAIAITGVFVAILLAAGTGFAAGFLGAVFGTRANPTLPDRVRVVGDVTREPVAAAAAGALGSVVNISVSSVANPGGLPKGHPDVPTEGTGSGVAFRTAPRGGTYILTNNHVVENADRIVVTDVEGREYKGTLVGRDADLDVAVVSIADRLPTARLGDSDALRVGQMVVAIGSPYGFSQSVSQGVVSALHRSLSDSGTGTNGSNGNNELVDVIQTDAAINPGNSGGALVNRTGELVGMNTAIVSRSGSSAGVGFAIPVNTAVAVATQLIAKGKVVHPTIGVTATSVDAQTAAQLRLPVTYGALVEEIAASSGATADKLRPGDVIVEADGLRIRNQPDLVLAVRRKAPGDSIDLRFYRLGRLLSARVLVTDSIGR